MTPVDWPAEVAAKYRQGYDACPYVGKRSREAAFAAIGRAVNAVRESDALAVASDWSDVAIDAAALAAWRETP